MGCAYGSLVLTSLHRSPLGEIINYIKSGTQETIFNGIGQYQVTGYTNEGKKPMLQIQTLSGRMIVVSEDQQFADRFDMNYNSVMASSLSVGQSIMVVGRYTTSWRDVITEITPVGELDSYNLLVEANHPYPASWFPVVPTYQDYVPTAPKGHNQGAYYDSFG